MSIRLIKKVYLPPVSDSYFIKNSLNLRSEYLSGSAKWAFLSLQKKWASSQLLCCCGYVKHSWPTRVKFGGHMPYMRLGRDLLSLCDWADAPPDWWAGLIFSKLTPALALDEWYWPHTKCKTANNHMLMENNFFFYFLECYVPKAKNVNISNRILLVFFCSFYISKIVLFYY